MILAIGCLLLLVLTEDRCILSTVTLFFAAARGFFTTNMATTMRKATTITHRTMLPMMKAVFGPMLERGADVDITAFSDDGNSAETRANSEHSMLFGHCC